MKVIILIKKAIFEFKEYAELLKVQQRNGSIVYWEIVMMWNLLRYGARPIDYVRFEFYKKSVKEKDRYMTIYRYFKIVRRLRKNVQNDLSGDKIGEYKYFKQFIRREWMIADKNTKDDIIKSFIEKHRLVIAKPNNGEQGKGVLKISVEDKDTIRELLWLKNETDFVIEECLKNTPEINVINPTSLNTVRVTTFIDKTENVRILSIILRVGAPGAYVDNWGSGGVGYNFDLETGICDRLGKDKKNRSYIFHPGSNVQMIGFCLPKFDELKEYVINLSKLTPQAKYVGWDVAITPNGFDLVEMNCPAGHDMFQSFDNPVYDILINNW